MESGLVEVLLRDLGLVDDANGGSVSYDPGALPLLAHALRVTWQRDGRKLTVAGYRRSGGIRKALAGAAEDAYLQQLGAPAQQIAREVLLRLVNVSEQGSTRDTRRRSSRSRLVQALPAGSGEAVDTVLRVFGRARLLTFDTDTDSDVDSVEITHEALMNAWPPLRQWIDSDRAGNLIRQVLEDDAAGWDRDRRDTAGLYRGSRLEAARDWATSTTGEKNLSPTASAFLAASIAQERRAVRLRRVVLVALVALALVASGAAVIAIQERDNATFNQIIAQADRLRATDVSLAAQLDLVAYRMRTTPDLKTPLLTAGNTALSTPLRGHERDVTVVAFSPDGHTLATGSVDNTVQLWNVTEPTRPTPIGPPLPHPNQVWAVAFSPDGRTLATGSGLTPRLWNVTDPAHPTPLGQLADH